MLELRNVTIKNGGQMYLHNCNCRISSQSIIVARNEIDTNVIARTLAGFNSVEEGEIHVMENILDNKMKSSKKLFFLITQDFYKIWKNYNILEISRLIKKEFHHSLLLKKYNIPSKSSIDRFTRFQRLIYLISVGQYLDRKIFILDQPTRYLDYEDLKLFYKFLNSDFLNANYIILTNRFEKIFEKLSKSTYLINANKLQSLKGGEEYGHY